MKPKIIGTGTGRSGTKSLAFILDSQEALRRCTHEHEMADVEKYNLNDVLSTLKRHDDISHAHFRFLGTYLKNVRDLKCIYIGRRNRDALRLSLYRAKEHLEYCENRHNVFNYNQTDKVPSVDEYLYMHDVGLKGYQSAYFNRILKIYVEDLNTVACQAKIAQFLEIPNWEYIQVHKHKGHKV